mgnify:FL=1
MEDNKTNAQVLEQMRVEASARHEQEEAQKAERWEQIKNNYFQGRPITEGVQCEKTPEEEAKQMQDEFNASCEYTHKVRESVAFDENGKYYIHPKNGQKVYFTHVSELPTWDNEYPENDTYQHGIKGNIPQDPNLQEEATEREPEPQMTCKGNTPTKEEITDYIKRKIGYELGNL